MPELPEVETIVRELKPIIVGKKVREIVELRPNTLFSEQRPVNDLGTIKDVTRRGKYIVMETDKRSAIVIHLRMTGKLILVKPDSPLSNHTRAIISFTDGMSLLFDDIRTFGTINIIASQEIESFFCKLGCEPFSTEFNTDHLTTLFAGRKTPVKNFLLDQSFIAGLGNIYVNEILYYCGIPPQRPVKDLSRKEISLLVEKTRQVLNEAIKHNGTSISDYRRVDNKTGSFQDFLKIYGKETCCLGHQIKRIKSSGRSTFYCPECQKEKLEK